MPRIHADIAWNDVEGALVLFDGRDGSYHALNPSASRIWRGIARGLPATDIARDCAACFSVDPVQAELQVHQFVAEALALGLLDGGQASA